MKNTQTKYVALTVALFLFISCSTKKNTWLSRNYQSMNTRYNVYFNGTEAYKKGMEKVSDGLVDDYSQILPLFTYHDHENLSRAKSDMERAVEKAMKAIKKHSIKKKPKRNASKMRDPKYQEWYNSEEFNPIIPKAYLLMGEATFYKGEFLESVGVFNYIIRHYSNFPEFHDARMWMARGYAEMGWLYEAENVLNTIAEDETFPVWKNGEYSQIKADILIKQEKYADAVPFLKSAISAETKKAQRRRLTFTLAQIYQEAENYENALASYQKVLKMSPSYEMSFNARIRLTEVFTGSDDTESIEKQLRRMLKDDKNKEYLDQIYYALANIEIERGHTELGIENLKLSVENSTQNPMQKARSLIQLADLYYQQDAFRKAQPYYKQAASLLDETYEDYTRVDELSRILNLLAGHLETIEKQDSLIMVAQMSETQRNKLVEGLIAQAVYKAEHPEIVDDDSGTDASMNLASPSDWYFYNASVVESGKRDFKRYWGNRPLEDNWRRTVKETLYADVPEEEISDDVDVQQKPQIPEDQTPEFYLKNIPLNEDELIKSKSELGESYIGAASLYKDNLKSYPDAEHNYKLLLKRIPDDSHALDAKFGLYQIYLETGRADEAEALKQEIVTQYPNSKYAVMLSNNNFAEELQKDKERRDSLYTSTYKAYMIGDYPRMFANVNKAYELYPNSSLTPNFMFMEALAVAKTDEPKKFQEKLKAIKKKYPRSEVVPHVDNLLEMMGEGLLPEQGGTGGPMNIAVDTSKIEVEDLATTKNTDDKPKYELDYDAKHYFVIIHPEADLDKIDLQFKLASFNFNRFLIKDFDISFIRLNRWYNILVINGFDGAEEAFWYRKTILEDGVLSNLINAPGVKQFVISENNFRTMANMKNPDAYQLFYNKYYKSLENAAENPNEQEQ